MGTAQTETSQKGTSPQDSVLNYLRRLIFGDQKPDAFTMTTFYINLVISFVFLLWSILSYSAISFRHLIFQQKKIPVESIIEKRGMELGFDPVDFLDRLLTFHAISIICWIVVLIGLVFLYRKNENFVYYFFGGSIFYLGMLIFYMSFNYYKEDTTTFDKIIFLILNLNGLMYFFLLRKENSGGSLSFFDEDEDDE